MPVKYDLCIPNNDKDLIELLEKKTKEGKRSKFIREAIHFYIDNYTHEQQFSKTDLYFLELLVKKGDNMDTAAKIERDINNGKITIEEFLETYARVHRVKTDIENTGNLHQFAITQMNKIKSKRDSNSKIKLEAIKDIIHIKSEKLNKEKQQQVNKILPKIESNAPDENEWDIVPDDYRD